MASATTGARVEHAHTVQQLVDTVRHAIGAADVRVDRVDRLSGHVPTGPAYWTDVDVRDRVCWRVHVERPEALDGGERRLVDLLAGMFRTALTAAEDSDMSRRLADLVDATLLELDAMIGATVEERLVKVARAVAEVLDATGWSVRILVDGEWMLVANHHRRGLIRDAVAAWAPFDPRVLELDEGSVAVLPTDDTPVSESLRHCDLSSLVAATGYDPDAVSWTLCMVGDDISGDLTPGRTALAALVPAALGFPLPPRSGGLLRSAG